MARNWNILFVCVFAIVNSVASTILLHNMVSSTLLDNSPICEKTSRTSTMRTEISKLAHRNDAHEPVVSYIRLRIYTGSSIRGAKIVVFSMLDIERIYNSIDHSKPLVLYIHGYRAAPNDDSVQTIIGAHLKRGSDNIMLLDWSDIAFGYYITVAAQSISIAAAAAETFDALVRMGLDPETFHCVGHSLGAHICGFLGSFSQNSIPRITGLDPANSRFHFSGAEHITAKHARLVDILHTDGGIYGSRKAIGTVDFFANGGLRPQPGCSIEIPFLSANDGCSHARAWELYAESVLNPFGFLAVQCSSNIDYVLGKCNGNQSIHFGYATPANTTGSFYFTTGSTPPFANKILKSGGTYAHSKKNLSDQSFARCVEFLLRKKVFCTRLC